MSTKITIGTRVAYSREWLRSCGLFTGWYPFARGTVTALNTLCKGCTIVTIKWDDAPNLSRVHIANLVREDKLHLERV